VLPLARRVVLSALAGLCCAVALGSCARPPAPPSSPTKPIAPSRSAGIESGPARSAETEAMSAPRRRPRDLAGRVFGDAKPQAEGRGEVVRPIAPAGGTTLSFLVYGDTRSDPKTHRALVQRMLTEPGISFVCHTGDLVGDGSKASEWTTWLGIVAPMAARVPLYPALGNHDLPRDMALQAFARLPGLPRRLPGRGYYYGVDCGPVVVAVLDSESLRKGDPEQLAWLRGYLSQSRAPLRVITLHRPLWSPGPNGSEAGIRKQLIPIAKALGVRLIFTAHDHMYYRTVREGLVQVITAGGGAPLYEVKDRSVIQQGDVLKVAHHYVRVDVGPAEATVRAIDLDGSLIDQFRIPLR
jgi:hypothetical protein